jgi:hypothetical protein
MGTNSLLVAKRSTVTASTRVPGSLPAMTEARDVLSPYDRTGDRNEQHRAALQHRPVNAASSRRAVRAGTCLHLLIVGLIRVQLGSNTDALNLPEHVDVDRLVMLIDLFLSRSRLVGRVRAWETLGVVGGRSARITTSRSGPRRPCPAAGEILTAGCGRPRKGSAEPCRMIAVARSR